MTPTDEDDGIDLLRLTPHQIRILQTVHMEELKKKVAVRFDTPADDESQLRRSVYLDGSIDMVEFLLDFDRRALSMAEQAKQELLSQQQGQSMPDDSDLF